MAPSIVVDYVVFVGFIIASTVYPIWDEIRSRKAKMTKQDFAFATGQVSVFAVMMSIARGQLGVRTFIGFPSEQYYRGSAMYETIYGIALAYPLVCIFLLPVYFNLEITSVYQYFDMRFKKRIVRDIASAIFILRSVFALGVTLFTPCVALYTIIDVPIYASLLALTGISICFTLFGGLKAAITADLIQGLTITAMSLLVIAQGVFESGGVAKVYDANRKSDRFQFFHISGDLRTRVDTLSAFLGQTFITLSILGCQQNLIQRYLSLKSEDRARKTLFMNIPFVCVLFTLPWIVGAVVYASYATCDPLKLGLTDKMDEILPFFVNDKMFYIPGFVGLFLATLFNGALCVSVSNVNSLAIVTWEDFVSQLPRFSKVTDQTQLRSIKVIGVIYSFLVMGIAFTVGLLSGVIETAMLTSSATTGPLIGVFLLSMFVPISNWKGASAGMIVALATCGTLAVGFLMVDKPNNLLETSIEGCTNSTFSPWIKYTDPPFETANPNLWVSSAKDDILKRSRAADIASSSTDPTSVFAVTYMYYSVLGTLIVLVVGTLVSWVTQSDDDQYESKLLHPYVLKLARFWDIPLRNNPETGASTFSIASCATTTTTTADPIGEIRDTNLSRSGGVSIIMSTKAT